MRLFNLTIAAAFVVYAVLTDSEEDEEPRIKRPDRGLLKRRQKRGAIDGIFKELRAEDLSSFKKFVRLQAVDMSPRVPVN